MKLLKSKLKIKAKKRLCYSVMFVRRGELPSFLNMFQVPNSFHIFLIKEE